MKSRANVKSLQHSIRPQGTAPPGAQLAVMLYRRLA